MRWTSLLHYSNCLKSSANVSKESPRYLKDHAKKVLMSSETIDQVRTGLKYCELAKATDLEEYKLWNDFFTIIKDYK